MSCSISAFCFPPFSSNHWDIIGIVNTGHQFIILPEVQAEIIASFVLVIVALPDFAILFSLIAADRQGSFLSASGFNKVTYSLTCPSSRQY